MARSAQITTDHDKIKKWIEKNGGRPAAVMGTGRGDDPGILRIDFPGYSGKGKLEPISYEQFAAWFDRKGLALLYREADRFNKIVSRSWMRGQRRAGAGARSVATETETEVRFEGPHAIDLLEHQHREIESLFSDYEDAEDEGEKQECFNRIADAFAAHGEIEETIFYPAIYAQKTEEELREAVEEHLLGKRIVADLLKMAPSDEQFDSKVNVLKEVIEHHVEEEEETLFPMVQKLDRQAMMALGELMESAYDGLMETEPRRRIPSQTKQAAPLPPT